MTSHATPGPMHDAEAQAQAASPLRRALEVAERRARRAEAIIAACAAAAACGMATLGAVLLDALAGLPRWGLLATDAMLLAIFCVMTARLVRRARRPARDPRHAAVALERHTGLTPSRLINALDLAGDSSLDPSTQTSEALRRMAVRRGESAAESLPANALVPRRRLTRALGVMALALGLLVSGMAALPRAFGMGVPRLLSPLADLPPYTPLDFNIAAAPSPVYVGKPAAIDITVTHTRGGDLPREAHLVAVDARGRTLRTPLNLIAHPDDSPPTAEGTSRQDIERDKAPPRARFAHHLERLDAPLTFFIDTPRGRSARHTLAPDTSPLFESLHLTITPPAYTGFASATRRLDLPHTDAAPIHVWQGSAVAFTAQSNVDLAALTLDFPPEAPPASPRTAEIDLAAPRTAEAMTVVDLPTRLTLTLHGRDGATSPRPAAVSFDIRQDQPPRVDLVNPPPIAVAPVDRPVSVDVLARDDVRVRALSLEIALDGRALPPIDLSPLAHADAHRARHTLDPAVLAAQPGSVLRYAATAHDNRPAAHGGPADGLGQRATTDTHELRFISRAEWDELARQRHQLDELRTGWDVLSRELHRLAAERRRLLDQLDALRDKLAAGESLTDIESAELATLEQQLADYRVAAEALAEAMEERAAQPSLYDAEGPLKESLRELAAALREQAARAAAVGEALAEGLAGEIPGGIPEGIPGADKAGGWLSSGFPGPEALPGAEAVLERRAERFAQADKPFDEASQMRRERLDPDERATRRVDAPSVPGVPARYQDTAAAYFQRLAEDAVRPEHEN